ncbi:MAG: ACT domain-containing protein [Ruthenibacterium sp.]
MNGVTKIVSEQDIMLITFTDADSHTALPAALTAFAQSGIVVDMISQSAPRATTLDFSFTTAQHYFETAMQAIVNYKATSGGTAPMISRGYSKINLFGEEMLTSCGVAATALSALAQAKIDVELITTSDLDISLLIREENEDSALLLLRSAFAIA